MTTTDQSVWARGSTAAQVTLPAPPAPPTYHPPTAEGSSGGGRGPRRRIPRWISAIAVLAAITGAGIGGWALRGATTPATNPATSTPSSAAPTPASALTPEQARDQACGAYRTLGLEWSAAYQTWLGSLPHPWTWTDPAVKTATAEFDRTAMSVASQLTQLTEPNTPANVTDSIRNVRLAIVALAASHGQTSTGADTDSQIDAVDNSMAEATRVCGSNG